MTYIIQEFMRGVGIFYIAFLVAYATFMFLSVASGAFNLYKRDRMSKISNELKHEYYIPISVIVPAYNEELTVVESINSLLNLDYKLYEIVIVDDGSTDNTVDELLRAFEMRECHRPIQLRVKCKPFKKVYEVQLGGINITLVTKLNGRKGDAINMGINASQFPYFLCIDADSLLQRDSLKKIVQPVLEDDSIIAVGGLIRISQGLEMEDGNVRDYHLPKNTIVCMQVVEYDRSFMASRIFMDMFNGNLIISGAFGLFKKSTVIAAGGYDLDTLGEDMDLAVRLHIFCRNNDIKYRMRYEPNAVCWTQAPTTLRDLVKQRRRWNLGLFQCLFAYRQIFANPRFGTVSFVSYLYYLLFELLAPFIELFGAFTIVAASCFGLLNIRYMIQYFVVYAIYGAILTVTAFYQRIYTQNLRVTAFDAARVLLMCLLESMFFRYVITFVRATSFIGYKKRKNAWDNIQRVKHTIG